MGSSVITRVPRETTKNVGESRGVGSRRSSQGSWLGRTSRYMGVVEVDEPVVETMGRWPGSDGNGTVSRVKGKEETCPDLLWSRLLSEIVPKWLSSISSFLSWLIGTVAYMGEDLRSWSRTGVPRRSLGGTGRSETRTLDLERQVDARWHERSDSNRRGRNWLTDSHNHNLR